MASIDLPMDFSSPNDREIIAHRRFPRDNLAFHRVKSRGTRVTIFTWPVLLKGRVTVVVYTPGANGPQ